MLDILWLAILLGLYIGVIPVYIGMLPIDRFRNLDPKWMTFLLCFTVGVLLFLLIDLGAEAMEEADSFIAAMQVADTATGSVPALDMAIFDLLGLSIPKELGCNGFSLRGSLAVPPHRLLAGFLHAIPVAIQISKFAL